MTNDFDCQKIFLSSSKSKFGTDKIMKEKKSMSIKTIISEEKYAACISHACILTENSEKTLA